MPRHTAARADSFSAALARLILACAALLGLLGAFALLAHAALPLWVWVVTLPNTAAATVAALLFALAPPPERASASGPHYDPVRRGSRA